MRDGAICGFLERADEVLEPFNLSIYWREQLKARVAAGLVRLCCCLSDYGFTVRLSEATDAECAVSGKLICILTGKESPRQAAEALGFEDANHDPSLASWGISMFGLTQDQIPALLGLWRLAGKSVQRYAVTHG
jgi:hypothetical protein